MIEPELITIVEGPTPEFYPSPQRWIQSIYEGPGDLAIGLCQMRTVNGEDILERCQRAWREGRPVRLDFPDRMRMRRQVNVVAMRSHEVDEGPMLLLWVSLPVELEEEELDEGDDGFHYS